ncbi:MAG: RNase H1/viroplasmin domain-containing protein, partial [Candidatus Wolfebacteria bacterium]|nr:RNase H1/viroplasmin domain-containing protein [Candidatus Wolfebacteria bacterium]
MVAKKYYAYLIPGSGDKGITENWKDCEKKVKGVENARFKSFKAKKDAEEWLKQGADYEFKKTQIPGVYFDAGTGRGNGVEVS